MKFVLPFTFTSLLVLSSLFFPARNVPATATSKNRPTVLENKSPCLPEDVYECQAGGGTFNWSHCTCQYW